MPAIAKSNRTPNKRLKQLRKICGLTQAELSSRAGTSLPTIVAVETGTLQMSQKLAGQIMFVTGVRPDSLLGTGTLLSVVQGKPMTSEIYEYFTKIQTTNKLGGEVLITGENDEVRLIDNDLHEQAEMILKSFRLTLWSAIKANRFHVLDYLWEVWRLEVTESLKLGDGMKGIAAEMNVSIPPLPEKFLKASTKMKPAPKRNQSVDE